MTGARKGLRRRNFSKKPPRGKPRVLQTLQVQPVVARPPTKKKTSAPAPPSPPRVVVEPDLTPKIERFGWSNSLLVVTPMRNCVGYVERYARSMLVQNVKFRAVVIDDCSTDGTFERAQKILGEDPRFFLLQNKERRGALANIIYGINLLTPGPRDVIATVDGDDWLTDAGALAVVLDAYEARPALRMTYGQFIHAASAVWGFCAPYSRHTSMQKLYRKQSWLASHLRTFRYELWSKIHPIDLRDPRTRKPWEMAWDCAMMFPMLEMCRHDEIGFIQQKVYVYNDVNVLNDNKVNAELQRVTELKLRAMPAYREVPP